MKEINAATLKSQMYTVVPNGSGPKSTIKGTQSFDSFLNTSNNAGKDSIKTDTVKTDNQVKDTVSQPEDNVPADAIDKQPDSSDSNISQKPGEDMAGTDSVTGTDNTVTSTKDSTSQAAEAVTAVSEAVKEAVKDITGLDDETLAQIMAALSMSYTDLLDMGNLKQFVMYINNTSDITDLLMNESMMSQLNNLADVIADIDMEALTGMTEENFAKLLQSIADGSFKMPEGNNAIAAGQENIAQTDIPVTTGNTGGEVLQPEAGQEEIVQFVVTKEDINVTGQTGQTEARNTEAGQEDGILQPGKETEENGIAKGNTENLKQGTDSQAGSTFTESTQTEIPVAREETFNSQAGFIQNLAQAAADVQDKAMPQQANMQTMINIVNQVVEQIKVTMGKEMTNMQLQLNPESLGKVLISVTSNHGVMTANFTVQSEEAKEALQSQMFSLREALEGRSLKVDAVEVEVSDFAFSQSSQADSQDQKEFNKGNGRRFKFELDGSGEEADEIATVSGNQAGQRLDNGSSIDFTA